MRGMSVCTLDKSKFGKPVNEENMLAPTAQHSSAYMSEN